MKNGILLLGFLAAVIVAGGCNSPSHQPFADECTAIRASLVAAGGRQTEASAFTRLNQALETSASYEFDSTADAALRAVKSGFPKNYRLVREESDELNYARTDGGDSVYVTVTFKTALGGKTQAKLLMKSLPS